MSRCVVKHQRRCGVGLFCSCVQVCRVGTYAAICKDITHYSSSPVVGVIAGSVHVVVTAVTAGSVHVVLIAVIAGSVQELLMAVIAGSVQRPPGVRMGPAKMRAMNIRFLYIGAISGYSVANMLAI